MLLEPPISSRQHIGFIRAWSMGFAVREQYTCVGMGSSFLADGSISKMAFVRYISRYVRRPPLAQSRLLPSKEREVRFRTMDKEQGGQVTTTYRIDEFISRLGDQVPDHCRRGIRHFGLLAPRSISRSCQVFWKLLGQRKLGRPKRTSSRESIRVIWGRWPLLDSADQRMYRIDRIPPTTLGVT